MSDEFAIPQFGRRSSLLNAFTVLAERVPDEPRIVETGTMRQTAWWGDGWSTVAFAWYSASMGGHLWTVDIDPAAIELARNHTQEFQSHITYVVDDSVHFLSERQEPIDCLYLDSYDSSWSNESKMLAAANHQLAEIQAAYPLLTPRSLVLIDDMREDLQWGKGAFTIPFLFARGWIISRHDLKNKQVLLVRP
jgi:predicted O-methyltransferase YrrM